MESAKVLVVEDEGIVARDIEYVLKGLGYTVAAITSSGEEAIEKAAETNPDLVLMDIVLDGDMDGVESAGQIRDRFDIPVVYLTAYSDDKTLKKAKITEPYGYVLKPFEKVELRITIEIALFKHKMEKKLKKSEEKYREIFEQANDAIFIYDLEAQKYVDVNQKAAEVLGYSIKELLRMGPRDIAAEKQKVPAIEIIEQCKQQGSVIFDYIAKKKDGTEVIFQAHTKLVRRDNKTLLQTFARDITETKKMTEQLLLADRLDILGRFAGGIAHEIRNPLAGINLYVDILKDKSEVEPSTRETEILDDIRNNVNRMAKIIRRVIDFADPSTETSMEIDINTLISEELDLWSERFETLDINPKLSLEDDIPSISGKTEELRQVLSNLIQNAVDAMEKAGALSIATDSGVSSFHKARPVVIIKVEDTGSGIKPDEMGLIYNPFFTTRYNKSGLGLAIVHQIVERHGGVITCESESGNGTTFTIELPCVSIK